MGWFRGITRSFRRVVRPVWRPVRRTIRRPIRFVRRRIVRPVWRPVNRAFRRIIPHRRVPRPPVRRAAPQFPRVQKAIARTQAAIAAERRQLQQVQARATHKQLVTQRDQLRQAILKMAVGAGIGAAIGGPVGAVIGAAIGGATK